MEKCLIPGKPECERKHLVLKCLSSKETYTEFIYKKFHRSYKNHGGMINPNKVRNLLLDDFQRQLVNTQRILPTIANPTIGIDHADVNGATYPSW